MIHGGDQLRQQSKLRTGRIAVWGERKVSEVLQGRVSIRSYQPDEHQA